MTTKTLGITASCAALRNSILIPNFGEAIGNPISPGKYAAKKYHRTSLMIFFVFGQILGGLGYSEIKSTIVPPLFLIEILVLVLSKKPKYLL
jgi:hypothetical protein